ncbi:MAG: hypothetical protein ACKVS6_17075 [Planctomycetota bacterium]
MNLKTKNILTILVVCSLTSCAYLKDRGRDAARIIEFDAGLTTGFQLHAGFSHVAEAGLGYYSGNRYGLREGGFVNVDEERSEFGVPIFYLHEVSQRNAGGAMPGRFIARPLEAGHERYPLQWFTGQITDREPFDLNFSANLAFIGASFTIRPIYLFDFAAGLVGVDLKRNDVSKAAAPDLVADLKSNDANVRRRAVVLLQQILGKRWPEYQSSPKREVFPGQERATIQQIEEDARRAMGSASAPRPAAVTTVPPKARDASFKPVDLEPARKAASGKIN